MEFPNKCTTKLTVSPCEALADQPQIITAEGLKIASKYTLVVQMERQAIIYQSYAHYVTNSEGTIDVSTMTSLGGSYEGVEPMGLIWFLEPLIKKPSAKVALKYQLIFDRHWTMHVYLLSGHVTPIDEDELISVQDFVAKTTAQRSIDHPRVSRYDVRDGRLKATLFVPEGQGPFLGVLDLFGWLPGVIYERRAALLAARGYITLALAYSEYEGQLDVNDMQLDYFLEALKWLDEHPKVAKGGVAITSHCMSSYIALHLAAICSKVKAIVAIGTPSAVPFGKVTHEGRIVASWPGGNDLQGDALTDVIAGTSRKTFPVIEDLIFPMETLPDDLDLLLMAAEDDKYISPEHTKALAKRLGKRKNVKVIINQGQGHSYSEPYVPLLRGQFLMKGRPADFGGQKYMHEKATEKVWIETLDFLEQCKLRLNVTGEKQ